MDVPDAEVPGWEKSAGFLSREWTFRDFSEAFGFMTRVALIAEQLHHHPNWTNTWNHVTIALTSHDDGGISELCVEFAQRVNRLLGE